MRPSSDPPNVGKLSWALVYLPWDEMAAWELGWTVTSECCKPLPSICCRKLLSSFCSGQSCRFTYGKPYVLISAGHRSILSLLFCAFLQSPEIKYELVLFKLTTDRFLPLLSFVMHNHLPICKAAGILTQIIGGVVLGCDDVWTCT
jgi:hypothetical protein